MATTSYKKILENVIGRSAGEWLTEQLKAEGVETVSIARLKTTLAPMEGAPDLVKHRVGFVLWMPDDRMILVDVVGTAGMALVHRTIYRDDILIWSPLKDWQESFNLPASLATALA